MLLCGRHYPFFSHSVVGDLVGAVKGRDHIYVLALGLLEGCDDLEGGFIEVFGDELHSAFLDVRYVTDARSSLLELDLEDVHSGLAEIVEVRLDGGIALFLVAVIMDEERRRRIGRVEGARHEGVHNAFFGVGNGSLALAGTRSKSQDRGSEKDRETEESERIFHILYSSGC